jgi:putative SOS response-associated peptidase YedK
MCGRYALAASAPDLAAWFHINNTLPFGPRINVAPTMEVPVVRERLAGGRELVALRWGLIPYWAEDAKIGYRLINARSESAADKPSFREPFIKRRCLVPATGFYEWKKAGRLREPFFIHPREGKLMAFAGLWDQWRDPEGKEIQSCTILTTAANELVRPIHDRMPAIIPSQLYDRWLDPRAQDAASVKPMLAPYPNEELQITPADPAINSAKYQPEIGDSVTDLPTDRVSSAKTARQLSQSKREPGQPSLFDF